MANQGKNLLAHLMMGVGGGLTGQNYLGQFQALEAERKKQAEEYEADMEIADAMEERNPDNPDTKLFTKLIRSTGFDKAQERYSVLMKSQQDTIGNLEKKISTDKWLTEKGFTTIPHSKDELVS